MAVSNQSTAGRRVRFWWIPEVRLYRHRRWFDVFDPGVVITTAPTERDVVDLLWTELRLQRERAGLPCHFIGARAPEMRTSEEHYAKGYTARKGESFQGRHRQRMLFIFDEGEGVDSNYWTTAKTMFKP
jgi:hypothetical protein